MDATEHRQLLRDSLFVLADLRLDGNDEVYRVKMRNLSSGGMMAEASLKAVRGMIVWTNIRNIGWVEGSVAWTQDTRFGVAFREEIDPKIARSPIVVGEGTPRFVKPPLRMADTDGRVRKI